jgi:hypothetical protein
MKALTRKKFLLTSSIAAVSALFSRNGLSAPSAAPSPPSSPPAGSALGQVPDFPQRGPQLDAAKVKRFVIAAHGNLSVVQEMLASERGLINATWDWGNGDFETALGGASHMGRGDIAEYLLEHGARMDIFAATMLGRIDIVKAAVATFPNIEIGRAHV